MARFSVRFAHLLQWVAEKAHKPLSQQLQILYTHLHTVLRHNVGTYNYSYTAKPTQICRQPIPLCKCNISISYRFLEVSSLSCYYICQYIELEGILNLRHSGEDEIQTRKTGLPSPARSGSASVWPRPSAAGRRRETVRRAGPVVLATEGWSRGG